MLTVLSLQQNRRVLMKRTAHIRIQQFEQAKTARNLAKIAPDYFTWALQRERRAMARKVR